MRWAKPLGQLCADLPLAVEGKPDVVIHDIVEDTRDITAGCLFVARPGGHHDGRDLVPEAERRGAVAVLSDATGCARASVATACCPDPDAMGVVLADRLFGGPSVPIVAITGTNGKTTTATFLQHFLGGGLIGSIEVDDGRDRTRARLTTPRPIELRRIFARMADHGCPWAVMEASSHGIALGRMEDLPVVGAVFTNLSGDHLDFHRTMEVYAAAKRGLFAGLSGSGFSVLNLDDPASSIMSAASTARSITCRMRSDGHADVHVTHGEGVHLSTAAGNWTLPMELPGEHNAMNLAQAWAAAHACGESPEARLERARSLPTPRGRLEPVHGGGPGPRVYVDFAHTDGALGTALQALRPLVSEPGRLIVVFGCGGDRDQHKRPRMAAIACELADEVHVTSDNPRTEAPGDIIDDILVGTSNSARVAVEQDRARAIAGAIEQARPEDVILVAGKGHEAEQIIGTERLPFDDRAVAMAALSSRGEAVRT